MIIKINYKSMNNNLFIKVKSDQSIKINGEEYNYDVDKFIFMMRAITCKWPSKLEKESIVDGVSCKIEIKDGANVETFEFNNKFPKDMYKLNNLIREVADDRKILQRIDQ